MQAIWTAICVQWIMRHIQPPPRALPPRRCKLPLGFFLLRRWSLALGLDLRLLVPPPFEEHANPASAAARGDQAGQRVDVRDEVADRLVYRPLGRQIRVVCVWDGEVGEDAGLAELKGLGDAGCFFHCVWLAGTGGSFLGYGVFFGRGVSLY